MTLREERRLTRAQRRGMPNGARRSHKERARSLFIDRSACILDGRRARSSAPLSKPMHRTCVGEEGVLQWIVESVLAAQGFCQEVGLRNISLFSNQHADGTTYKVSANESFGILVTDWTCVDDQYARLVRCSERFHDIFPELTRDALVEKRGREMNLFLSPDPTRYSVRPIHHRSRVGKISIWANIESELLKLLPDPHHGPPHQCLRQKGCRGLSYSIEVQRQILMLFVEGRTGACDLRHGWLSPSRRHCAHFARHGSWRRRCHRARSTLLRSHCRWTCYSRNQHRARYQYQPTIVLLTDGMIDRCGKQHRLYYCPRPIERGSQPGS